MIPQKTIEDMEVFAAQIRLETFKEFAALGFGHIGGAMSIADVLAVLYGGAMRYDPKNPEWEDRDWLVLSKGHSGPALYAALALKGFFPMEELKTLNRPGTNLPSHCSRINTAGIDLTTGSLGQGMSSAIGAAVASKILHGDNYVYLIVGDGELDEGQVWEGALFASHHGVSNLVAFVDKNGKQLDGPTDSICALGDIGAKFREFGWFVQEVDGHEVRALYESICKARDQKKKPSMIVMNTVKGKGCVLAEGVEHNHHMTLEDHNANKEEIKRLERTVEGLIARRMSR